MRKQESDIGQSSRWLAGCVVAAVACVAMAAMTLQRRAHAAGAPAATQLAPVEAAPANPGESELTGQVIDADGKGIPDMKIILSNQLLNSRRQAPYVAWNPLTTTTDDHGNFGFKFLNSGHTDVWAEGASRIGWIQHASSNGRGVVIRVHPQTDAVQFEGMVVDGQSQPIAGGRILLVNEVNNDSKIIAESKTDAAGAYRVGATPKWSYKHVLHIVVVLDNRIAAWRVVPYCSAGGVDLQLKAAASIHGRVVNNSGNPALTAKVAVRDAVDPDFGFMHFDADIAPFAPSAMCGADGSFILDGLPLGARVGIRAWHPAVGQQDVRFVELLKGEQEVANIRLAQGIVIEGIVRMRADNKPVEGALVTLGYPSMPPETMTTDKDGHYLFGDVAEFDGKSQRSATAEAGGSPPLWEGTGYYEKPLKAGDRATLEILLDRSRTARMADWKQQAGAPAASKYNIAILDDADPAYQGKTSYDDTLTLLDSSGKSIWKKTGLNITQNIGGNHVMAADLRDGSLWVSEASGQRLLKFSRDGRIEWEKPGTRANMIAIDPKTGDGWVVTSNRTIYGDGLKVFAPDGQLLQQLAFAGYDIVYSPHDDCFWLINKEIIKVSREGRELVRPPVKFPWVGVSVSANEVDGSIWVAERRHPNVTDSRGQLWVFEPDGRTRKVFSVDTDNCCVEVDAAHNAVWVGGVKSVFKLDLDGKIQAEIPISRANVCVEKDTGYAWCTARDGGIWRVDTAGKPVLHQDAGQSQRWLCAVPK